MTVVWFVVAAGCGAALRVVVGWRLNRRWPVGTVLVNVLASFALGLVAGAAPAVTTVVGVAFLGALSTWSSLANETAVFMRTGRLPLAVVHLASSIVAGVAAAGAGLALAT